MYNVLNSHPTYDSMSSSNNPIMHAEYTAAATNQEPQTKNIPVDGMNKGLVNGLPPPSAGPPYPKQPSPYSQQYPNPPAYSGEGTYVHPYSTKQKG